MINKENIKKYKKIYVACPARVKTGGTELLHQLVAELRKIKVNVTMVYTTNTEHPTPDAFKRYVDEYVYIDEIEDSSDNLLILSEVEISHVFNYNSINVAVWWLSVDNYLKYYGIKEAYRIRGWKGVLGYVRQKGWTKKEYPIGNIRDLISINYAQSYYAIDFLKKNNFNNIVYLSDYINMDYIESANIKRDRKNVVLYNPVKGKAFTKRLMKMDRTIQWKPLVNMSNEEVRENLETSKVYVDFGNHPGKDRFPREAAICGCCVITGKRGAAAFDKDVSIPKEYKFEDKPESYNCIIKKIKDCFDHFEERQNDFSNYRELISNEPSEFLKDVKKIFGD